MHGPWYLGTLEVSMAIRGLHGLFYSSQADEMRAFMRDKLRLPYTDVGGGWLIFDLPEADVGVHPIDESGEPESGTHDVSFFCDDINGTVAGLRARGVGCDEVADHGYGFVTHFTMPGGVRVQLYEPKYTKPARQSATKTKAKAKASTKTKKKVLAKAARSAGAKKKSAGKAKAKRARRRR